MNSVLHLLNGDATADQLRGAGLPGTLAVWADILYEGPVPQDLFSESGRQTRARFIAGRGYASFEDALALHQRWYGSLESSAAYDEVVIWLEHDLFDQLLLLHHLHWFSGRPPADTRLTLICIDDHPDVEHFKGLGQLSPAQLAPLFGTRTPVTRRELDLGATAWAAFTSPDPTELERLLERDTSLLPFVAPALRRLLQEYPSTRDGLSRTERQILQHAADAPLRVADLFHALHRQERFYFVTNASLVWHLRELSGGAHPLVAWEQDPAARSLLNGTVSLTDAGSEVLAGRADRVRLLGIDRWLGGVHLDGTRSVWRWDESAGRLVG